MIRFVLAIFFATPLLYAQDLDSLRSSLEALRPHAQQHRDTRGATAAFTQIKHRVRDWVEARLASFPRDGDEDALNREFQETMARARLLCPDGCVFTALGYLDPVHVEHQGEFLIVRTSLGIACGYDDSAYVYERSRDAWRRIFETEQNNYTPAGYLPQTIYSVQISPPDPSGARFVVTLGSRPACSNAFLPVYYRLWRIRANDPKHKENARKLLDASETAYIGAYPPIRATLSSSDLRIQFTAGGTGYGSGHEAERRFEISANGARQIEPIAPTPRDFVEEWLAQPWTSSAPLSESASLETWHKKLHRDDGMGDFPDAPIRCSSDPDLWQIGIRLHGVEGETFYLVRWRQPDHFTMADIADHPLCKP